MSVKDYIDAMPKVALRVRLEGIYRKETLLMIAEQNDIASTVKKFEKQTALLDDPSPNQFDELIQTVGGWLQHPDDLVRLVYDMGVLLAKQNVKYAEVYVNPSLHMLANMTFDDFIRTLNDGRDRVERGWGVRIQWIINIPRNEPRRSDEALRWASSATGRHGGIVGIALSGSADSQPIGQFERAFVNAKKKEVQTASFAGDKNSVSDVQETLEILHPDRLLDGWGILESSDLADQVVSEEIPVDFALSRAVRLGFVADYDKLPLRQLYDDNFKLTISADMPSIYQTTLSDEYLLAVEKGGLSIEELEEIALNAIAYSFLSEDDKAQMREEFLQEYKRLRDEYLTEEVPTES